MLRKFNDSRVFMLFLLLCILDFIGYFAAFAIDEGGGFNHFGTQIIFVTLEGIFYILSFPFILFFESTGITNLTVLFIGSFIGCLSWAFLIELLILKFGRRKQAKPSNSSNTKSSQVL
jgi:hypothetical protein